MKYMILMVFGAGILAGSAFYLKQTKAVKPNLAALSLEVAPVTEVSDAPRLERVASRQVGATASSESVDSKPSAQPVATVANTRLDAVEVRQAVDLLVSPQASFEQKRAAWKQLKDGGGLDQAIGELEQRVANSHGRAEYAATLGQAYLQKCGTISDVREQGILAMQADKVFDTALSLDPTNWEARFTKAVALSYWPATMGKGEEVIQHFLTLVQQQETQPAQPQFADTYVLLGEQYQKADRNEDARTVWQRGSALFPENDKLRSKLASP